MILVSKIVSTAFRCLWKAAANNYYSSYRVYAFPLPTVHMEQRECHRSDFREILCFIFLKIFVDIMLILVKIGHH